MPRFSVAGCHPDRCKQSHVLAGLVQHGNMSAAGGSAPIIPPISEWGQVWNSGAWWMLLAAQSMAVGTVLVPWVSKKADNIMATGYHMLLGGLPLAILAAVQEGDELAERLPLLTGAFHYGMSSQKHCL